MNSEIIAYYFDLFNEFRQKNQSCGFVGYSNCNLTPTKSIPFSVDYYKEYMDKQINEIDIDNHFIILKNNLIFALFDACKEYKEKNTLDDVKKVLEKQIDNEQKLWEINSLIETKEKFLDGIVYMLSFDVISNLKKIDSLKVSDFLKNYNQKDEIRFAIKDDNYYVLSQTALNFERVIIKKDHKTTLESMIETLYSVNINQNFNNYYQKGLQLLKENDIDKAIENLKLSIDDGLFVQESYSQLAKIEFDRGRYIECLKYADKTDNEYYHIMTRIKTDTNVEEIVQNYDNIKGKYPDIDKIISDIFLQKANVCFADGKKEEGADLIKRCIYADQKNAFAYYKLASIKFEDAQLEEALSLIDTALSITRDVMFLDLKAKICFDMEEYDNSIELYNQILSIDNTKIDTYLGLGLCYFIKEDYKNSLLNYGKLIEIDPNNKEAYQRRIAIYKYLKNYDKTLSEVEKVLTIYSDDFEFLYERAKIYEYKKLFEKALADYKHILKLKKDFIYAYYQIALIENRNKNFKAALDNAKKTIELYEGQSDIDILQCYKIIAVSEIDLKNYAAALDYLDKIFEQENWTEGFIYYAEALKNQRQYEKAIEYYKSYLDDSNEDNQEVFFKLSQVYFEIKDYNLASDYISRAIMIDSTNYEYYYQRGNVRKALDRHSEAILDFDKAISFNPNVPVVYIARGTTKKEIGKIKEAFDDFKRASSLKELNNSKTKDSKEDL